MDLELAVTGQKEFLKNKGMGSRDTRLSVGDQAVTSRNGFVIRPDSKGAKPNVADVNIDLTKLDTEVTYFSAIVGNDDNSPIIRAYGVNRIGPVHHSGRRKDPHRYRNHNPR